MNSFLGLPAPPCSSSQYFSLTHPSPLPSPSPSLPLPSPPLPSPVQGSQILQCYNAHNSYLFAIQAYNSRCEAQYKTTLPELLDVSGGVAEGVASVLIRILK